MRRLYFIVNPISGSGRGRTRFEQARRLLDARGADYGFASTISLVIFLMVALITFFNFRFTQSWEEISENV